MLLSIATMNLKSRKTALWIVAAELAVVLGGSTLLTPLYLLYKQRFGFSEVTLTLIYSVYVLGNLVALFIFGRLSDQIGRRITTLPVLAIAGISTLVFLFAFHTWSLFVGRFISGVATGLAAGTATAWIAELHGDKTEAAAIASAANLTGIALGPLLSGLLAAFAPLPLRLSYVVYMVILLLVAAAVSRAPETVENPVRNWEGVELRPRVGVPRQIRAPFVSPAVTAFGIFALGGFYCALVPGLLARSLGLKSPAASGTIVFGLFIVAAITAALLRKLKSQTAMLLGLSILLPSVALLVVAETARSLPLVILATVLGGVSVALGYCGSLQVINEIAPEDQRSEVVSSYLIAVYFGNSIPVVGLGLLSGVVSSLTSHAIFAGVVAAFAVIGLITGWKYPPARQSQMPKRESGQRAA